MIIDEADRMLDMGFEREMDACLALIKKRCKDKFHDKPGLFQSDSIKINFISATLSNQVQALGAKLMSSYASVGFGEEEENPQAIALEDQKEAKTEKESIIDSIPRQVKQFWIQVPTQYRLLYLLAFLYSH